MKRTILPLVLMIALAGCQFLPGLSIGITPLSSPTPDSPVLPVTPPPSFTPPPAAAATFTPAPALLLVSKQIDDNHTQPAYTLKVTYPQLANPADPALLAFNQQVEAMAKNLVAAYQKDFNNPQYPPDSTFGPGFMSADYRVTNGTHGLLSILFTVADYYSGAAHPNQHALVFNFDLKQGKKLALAALFLPGANYLQALADDCIAQLQAQGRLEFDAGAQPTAENYQNWNITPQGLLISFDPYQVAPYAMGPSTVTVSYNSLANLIDPKGPIAVFIH